MKKKNNKRRKKFVLPTLEEIRANNLHGAAAGCGAYCGYSPGGCCHNVGGDCSNGAQGGG